MFNSYVTFSIFYIHFQFSVFFEMSYIYMQGSENHETILKMNKLQTSEDGNMSCVQKERK